MPQNKNKKESTKKNGLSIFGTVKYPFRYRKTAKKAKEIYSSILNLCFIQSLNYIKETEHNRLL